MSLSLQWTTMLQKFFAFYRPYRGLFLIDFGCAIISGLLELGFPMAVKLFVDILLPSAQWGVILAASIGLLAIYVINTGLMAVVTYWGHMLGINIETDMRRLAFSHIQKLSFRYFDNQKTGHLVGRLTKDLEEIGEVAHHGPEDLFIAVMTFLGAFALMLSINVQLALLTAVVVPLTAFVTSRPTISARCSAVSVISTPVSRRMSAASVSFRPSPTRRMSAPCSSVTTRTIAPPSSKPIGSWRPALRCPT